MILFRNGELEYSGNRVSKSYRVESGQTLSLRMALLSDARVDIEVDIEGSGAEVDIRGVYLCKGTERANVNIRLHHNAPGSSSTQLFKGIVDGSARVNFDGLIVVRPGADGTEALQTNCNLLLSEDAVVTTSPQLEIYADDVKCSHGATVGALNEDEQFYLRSRGVSIDEAKRLQMLSFLAPVLEGLPEDVTGEVVAKL